MACGSRGNDHGFQSQQEPPVVGSARSRGRPRFEVSKSQIEGLRELGFSWSNISRMIGVSRIPLHRRRVELGLEKRGYREIDDQELDVNFIFCNKFYIAQHVLYCY